MANRYTLEDIAAQTGAKMDLLRGFYKDLKIILEPLSSRGDKNRLFFDSGGVKIFEQAYQMKTERGMTRSEIKRELEKHFLKTDKTDIQTFQNRNQTEVVPIFVLEKLEEASNKAFEAERRAYQTQLEAKQAEMKALRTQLLLLTDGRDPEEVKKEEEEKRKRKVEILDRLQEIEGKWFKGEERKKLLEELRGLG